MLTVQQAFDLALQHHQAGRLAEAEALYRQILAAQPSHSSAIHFLGVIAHQTGRNDLAIELIRQAIALNPNDPFAHSNLGETYRSLGRAHDAIAHFRRALDLRPDYAEAHLNLGIALQQLGRMEEAIVSYRSVLQLRPNYASAYVNLGLTLASLGQLDEAVAAYYQAESLAPDIPELYNNLCAALIAKKQFEEALKHIRRALELRPDYAEAHNHLGMLLTSQGLGEAEAAYRRAIELKPDFAEAYANLGNVLRIQGQVEGAIAACNRALQLRPNYSEAHTSLGSALRERGNFDAAISAHRRALETNPNLEIARFNLSIMMLSKGEFEQGWPLFEARWGANQIPERRFDQPQWNGGDVTGRRILIHAEQGFGDSIQFIRFAPLLAERGAHVIVESQRPLVELFRSVKGISELFATGDPLPAFDLHVPMLSLPGAFQTKTETIPREVPYLFADSKRVERWQQMRWCDRSRLKVGFAWIGNPENPETRKRKIPLNMFSPIWCMEGVSFFSLQIQQGTEPIEALPSAANIHDYTSHIHDFADTAALMSELDLIISIDTAVAHVAGALGFPVWTLLPFVPSWRWGLKGEHTPWYPTMRLFRQPALGDWDSVIQRVAGELERAVAEKRSHAH